MSSKSIITIVHPAPLKRNEVFFSYCRSDSKRDGVEVSRERNRHRQLQLQSQISKRFSFPNQVEDEAGVELPITENIRDKMEESGIYIESECAHLREDKKYQHRNIDGSWCVRLYPFITTCLSLLSSY